MGRHVVEDDLRVTNIFFLINFEKRF